MTYSLKPLGRAHVKDVEALWRVDVEDEGATSPPGIALLDPPDEHYEDAAITGAFAAGRLVAAMKWGRRRADAPGADFDNLHPGDGVVFWLFFTDPAGADALLARARTSGAARIYAFPEGGDLARLTLFETGMLSLRRKRAVNYFERSGFVVPAGDAWGPQERIGFRLAIPDRVDVPTLPPGFRIEVHTTERACRLLLLTESGERIGEANMGPARMNGLDVPRSFFLHWLGVDGAYRDRGFGRMLLLNQIEHARRLGATDLYLTTHSGRPAWKLYQRIGFTEVDRFRSYVLEVKRVDAAPSPRELCGETPQLRECATVDAAPSPRELCGEAPQLRGCATVDVAPSPRVLCGGTPQLRGCATVDKVLWKTYFDPRQPIGFLRGGSLPHWRQQGSTYFVTWRTADSMPISRVRQWSTERDEWLARHPEPHDLQTQADYDRLFPDRWEQWLDESLGACELRIPEVKALVEADLLKFDGDRHRLEEWVVMPNHVHVLVTPLGLHTLTEIVHGWKSFTAHAINRLLGRKGALWQKEYFDHIVRSADDMTRFRNYILRQKRD